MEQCRSEGQVFSKRPLGLIDAAPKDAGFSASRLARLTAWMQDRIDAGEIPGAVILAARAGQVVLHEALGMRNLATGAPMMQDTLFRIYSQTKPVIGAAMMILRDEGLWDFDDLLEHHIPEFKGLQVFDRSAPEADFAYRPPSTRATLRNLLTHTAGFTYGMDPTHPVSAEFQAKRVMRSMNLQDLIDRIASIPLVADPGEAWNYSIGVDIQGYLIEKLSGRTLGEFLRERLFDPMGMADTGFIAVDADRLSELYFKEPGTGRLSPMHARDFNKPPPFESGGGGLVCTARDYARFCQMLLNQGEFGGVRVMSAHAVGEMLRDHLPPALRKPGSGAAFAPLGPHIGHAVNGLVIEDPVGANTPVGRGAYCWGGVAGSWFWIDPENDLFFLGMIQRFGSPAGDVELNAESRRLIYEALD